MPAISSLLSLLRPFPPLLLAALGIHLLTGPPPARDADVEQALVQALADEHGLAASPSDVTWIDSPDPRGWPEQRLRAWVLAEPLGRPNDVFLVFARRAREGGLLGVSAAYDVTDTFAADEGPLAGHGALAAWGIGDGRFTYRVQIADADTPHSFEQTGLGEGEQLRWRLTWLQKFGQMDGIATRSFKLVPPASTLELRVDEASVTWSSPEALVVVPRHGAPREGGRYVQPELRVLPAPGHWVTWAVDRVRALPWFGSERMQLLKAVVYRGLDWVEQRTGIGSSEDEPPEEWDTRIATEADPTPSPSSSASTDSASTDSAGAGTALPEKLPTDLTPLLDPAETDEGRWQSLHGDPFIRASDTATSSFWTTFIRPDPKRKFTRVLIVAWDPSLLDLHMMSGTEEPKSATGATGPGIVPDEHLDRLVAAFNGGFQGTHGNFGMAVEGTLYVPPKPFAATVARLANGRTAFGTWPPGGTELPAEITSFRQNLTPLVSHGHENEYGRVWWGGVPEGWQDDTQTVRSGLCRTADGFVAYFYGTKTDAGGLARAMLAARCEYGLHLDMNQGHTGLEFYNVASAAELPPLGLPLSKVWQTEGDLGRVAGYRFRGRRLFRGMQLMNFPRYIRPESRDFFYLTLRERLPGRGIARAPHLTSDEAHWSTEGLPQPTRPLAIARASLRADPTFPESRLHLLKLDPWRFEPSTAVPETGRITSWAAPRATEPRALYWLQGELRVASEIPTGGVALFRGSDAPAPTTRAAAAIDHQGMLLYGEIATGGPPEHSGGEFLQRGLELAGAKRVVYLPQTAGVQIAGKDLSQHPSTLPSEAVHLGPWRNPGFEDIFTDTPVVSREVWQPLQKSVPRASP